MNGSHSTVLLSLDRGTVCFGLFSPHDATRVAGPDIETPNAFRGKGNGQEVFASPAH